MDRREHDLRPGSGSRREFSPFGAFLVVFAAALLEHGLSQSVTRAVVNRFCDWAASTSPTKHPLLDAFQVWRVARDVRVLIGDRSHMKIEVNRRADGKRKEAAPKAMPWTDVNSGERQEKYKPLVKTQVELAELVRRLKKP